MNPLKKYLSEQNMTHLELCEKLEQFTGFRWVQPTISRWVTGKAKPTKVNRLILETVSEGAIAMSDWDAAPSETPIQTHEVPF